MSDNIDLQTAKQKEEIVKDESTAPVTTGPSSGGAKNVDAVGEDHPLVEETGESALETQTESGAGEFLSDFIYESDEAWVREWLQNHETACVRAAKLLIRLSDEYADGWLTQEMWVDEESGETVVDPGDPNHRLGDFGDAEVKDIRSYDVPRPIEDVLQAASSLGYEPIIGFEVKLDEQEIVTYDNGIGMTPREFDVAFNTIFKSGSGVDGETGGQFGVGSESAALVTGKDGGAICETYSRRPGDHDGFKAYSYLGGANALPGEVDEDFRGTRFTLPVCENFNLNKLQRWLEIYAEKLRVPVKYDEYDAGSHPVDEEYEATTFVDDYDDSAITIERQGEFSIVAGPNVYDNSFRSDDENTYLVSMPIERNTKHRFSLFWDFVIQIHDEQGRIVSGPNRGLHEDDIDSLHADDIRTPKPTGDRDRFQKSEKSKDFWRYIESEIKSREMGKVGEIIEEMKEADHPAHTIENEKGKWRLLDKMVSYHGSRKTTDRLRNFKKFMNERDEVPDMDDDMMKQVYSLYQDIQYCSRSPSRSTKKSKRSQKTLGQFIAKYGMDDVFMAASTGGNFVDRFRVVKNNIANPKVIVISGASKYDKWAEQFGFKVLKEVPVKQSDDHDYDVTDKVHQANKKTVKSNTGKADEIEDRTLKIRTDSSNSSIDLRISIKEAERRLKGSGSFKGHSKLVLFTSSRDTPNISDNYDFAKWAAIASVSGKEYKQLADYDDVVSMEEYKEWSKSALIATEDGAMTPEELVNDDRMVIVASQDSGRKGDYIKLLSDDYAELRDHYTSDIHSQMKWAKILDGFDGGYHGDDVGNVPDSAKPDTLFAVAGQKVMDRATYAFRKLSYDRTDITGMYSGYNSPDSFPIRCSKMNKSKKLYQTKVDTPNWDDDSEVYDMIDISSLDEWKSQVLLGFHDQGIDPSEKSADELRDLMGDNN